MKQRPIYLTPELAELTRKLIGVRASGHLFLNADAEPWTTDTVRLRFSRLRKSLGLSDGVIPYGTQHRFPSDAINRQKMDSLIVARLLGHSDARMLQKTYVREDTAQAIGGSGSRTNVSAPAAPISDVSAGARHDGSPAPKKAGRQEFTDPREFDRLE